jgi:putative pyrroloquinoline-quinone binding quinoprotein
MTEDFTTRLRLELRDAALREEQRGGLARAGASLRVRPALGSLVVAAAVGIVLLVGLWMVSSTTTETAKPVPTPRIVANVPVTDGLGRSAWIAFGSVWLSDTNAGDILRVDPRTRKVIKRIHVGSEAVLAASNGSMWAIPSQAGVAASPLMRIDPRTNTIVARIPMRSPGTNEPFLGRFLLPGPGTRMWAIGGTGMLAIDTARGRPVREVDLPGGFQIIDAGIWAGQLVITRADRSIVRYDGITGRRLGRVAWQAPNGFLIHYADKAVKVGLKTVSLADPTTGKPLWRTRIGTELNQADVLDGRLFVEGSNGATSRDVLWELDVHTGRVIGSRTVPGFSVLNLFHVGHEIWMTTADGHVIVAAP